MAVSTCQQDPYVNDLNSSAATMQMLTRSVNPRCLITHQYGSNGSNFHDSTFQPVPNMSQNSSQAMPYMTNPRVSNRWSGAPITMPQHMHTGQTSSRHSAVPVPPFLAPDYGERQLKRKLSTMLLTEQLELLESNCGDFTVICGGRSWKVHSYIVAPRCNFFAAAAKWKKEQEEKTIDMTDDDPYAVDILLRYIYTRDSELVGLTAPFTENPAQTMAKIAIVADKYDQPDLFAQVRIEFMKLTHNLKQLEEPDKRARDALLALVRLREHDTESGQLRVLEMIVLRYLRDSKQLQIMDDAMIALLENEVQADPSLATLLIKYCAGGQLSPGPSPTTKGRKSLQCPTVIH